MCLLAHVIILYQVTWQRARPDRIITHGQYTHTYYIGTPVIIIYKDICIFKRLLGHGRPDIRDASHDSARKPSHRGTSWESLVFTQTQHTHTHTRTRTHTCWSPPLTHHNIIQEERKKKVTSVAILAKLFNTYVLLFWHAVPEA